MNPNQKLEQADAESLLNQYLAATPAEQRKFNILMRGMGTPAPKKESHAGSDAHVLWDLVWTEYKRWTGHSLPRLASLKRDTGAESMLDEAVRWLTNPPPKTLSTKLALFKLAAECSVIVQRASWHPPNGKDQVLAMIGRITQDVDQQYPGYRENGLLLRLAESVAAGKLPKEKSDPLQE